MIVEVARAGAEDLLELTVLIDAALAKTGVGLKIVTLEIQIVLNQGSSKECVVTDAVSTYPGIEQGQGEEKKQEQQALRLLSAGPEWRS
jgi:D-serine deaminase-like pyridoxal phosphate-dependent protein